MAKIELSDMTESTEWAPSTKVSLERSSLQQKLRRMNGMNADEIDYALSFLKLPKLGFEVFDRMYMRGDEIFAARSGDEVCLGRIIETENYQ